MISVTGWPPVELFRVKSTKFSIWSYNHTILENSEKYQLCENMSVVHQENFRFLSSIVLEKKINVWDGDRRESLCFRRREWFLQTLDDNISVKYCQKLLIFFACYTTHAVFWEYRVICGACWIHLSANKSENGLLFTLTTSEASLDIYSRYLSLIDWFNILCY